MCIDVPKAATAAADGDGRDNAVNVDGGHPPAVSNNDAVASITTTVSCPNKAPLPSSFDAHLLGGFTWTRRRRRQWLPLCCSARKPGTILSFSGYSHLWRRVERWRNTTINRSWRVRDGITTSRCRNEMMGPRMGHGMTLFVVRSIAMLDGGQSRQHSRRRRTIRSHPW